MAVRMGIDLTNKFSESTKSQTGGKCKRLNYSKYYYRLTSYVEKERIVIRTETVFRQVKMRRVETKVWAHVASLNASNPKFAAHKASIWYNTFAYLNVIR